MTAKHRKHEEHPMAALFPMLSDLELKEMAENIKEVGLQHPIVLDKDGLIVDGRNRLAACELAKVEPAYETLNGIKSEEFIIAQNLARRHMNAGQRAMVAAMMYPNTEAVGRGKKGIVAIHFPMVSKDSLHRARKVIRLARDLAPNVLNGSLSLEKAYSQAKDREDLASSQEHKMAMLREAARDLADRVEDGMDVDEALAAMKERERKRIETIEHGKQAAETGLSRFLADVASIAAAVKLTDEKLLDKKKVNAVVRAADQLQSLI